MSNAPQRSNTKNVTGLPSKILDTDFFAFLQAAEKLRVHPSSSSGRTGRVLKSLQIFRSQRGTGHCEERERRSNPPGNQRLLRSLRRCSETKFPAPGFQLALE